MAWRAFSQAHSSVIVELEREMQEHQGLPLIWYDILANLERAPNYRLRMKALADSILLSRSGLTRLLDRMAAAGLVIREPCLEDLRDTYVSLTDRGRHALVNAAPGREAGIERHFLDRLSDDDIETLLLAFGKVSDTSKIQPLNGPVSEPLGLQI
jgi:DNA-binding MarR family transcriptional regulator